MSCRRPSENRIKGLPVDPAVALVKAYMQINGFFTIAEFPIIESLEKGGYRSVTDLDILAVRFPGAGRLIPSNSGDTDRDVQFTELDPALEVTDERLEFVIGEVKEGRAELNEGATKPLVIRTALTRFGAFNPRHIDRLVAELIEKGEAITPGRKARVRLFSFGTLRPKSSNPRFTVMTLKHVLNHIERLEKEHRNVAKTAQFKDPALGMLMVLFKAKRGAD